VLKAYTILSMNMMHAASDSSQTFKENVRDQSWNEPSVAFANSLIAALWMPMPSPGTGRAS
jgi:hypothetical protein